MKNNKLILLALSLMAYFSQAAFAANNTYDSTAVLTVTVAPIIECTRFKFNDVDSNSTPAMNAATFDPSRCIKQINGSVTLNADIGNGNLGKACPNNYPRLRTTIENWFLIGGGFGTPNASAWCCQDPPNKVKGTTAWENTSNSGGCT
jgi:hypothetical protein